ncbi:sialidase [Ureibacillus chungkukjangi]|uniref:F510_1955 family glycosylhydrolase n=1 Tax=Ureibacillus chungkukjangi TaxID=1202712 RepID=UPI00203B9D41|nr:sialidase [Ureibacillus chungkukjangi]MCM3390498.1 sialidase [Ureibacillus chungkukjangi]
MKMVKILFGLLFISIILVACNSEEKYSFENVKNEQIDHVHGLGYANGGNEFLVATHNGLYQFEEKTWKVANSQKHDYMGFAATVDGFYSSGHPEEGSNLKNPFGLIKSTDKGADMKQLAFYGELDFHYLTVGYASNTIYVFNETPKDNLEGGLHYSTDEGKKWTKVALNGFNSSYISNFAAHPSKEGLLVIGSKEGIYLSEDYGQNFSELISNEMVTYVTLNEDEGIYSSIDESQQVYLKLFTLESKAVKDIKLPKETKNDPIIYLAVNPNDQQEIIIVTNDLSIYQTKDQGNSWNGLAVNGNLVIE